MGKRGKTAKSRHGLVSRTRHNEWTLMSSFFDTGSLCRDLLLVGRDVSIFRKYVSNVNILQEFVEFMVAHVASRWLWLRKVQFLPKLT